MAENLLDIQVDADDYAETAAGDIPSTVDRTYVSEEQFQKTKIEYKARIESGNIHLSLPDVLPLPAAGAPAFPFDRGTDKASAARVETTSPSDKPRLSGKNVQVIAAAAGELYYFAHYERLLNLLAWLEESYDIDKASLKGRRLNLVFADWASRCKTKLDR